MHVETPNRWREWTAAWIGAMRLRTLPLAAACTITGACLARWEGTFDSLVFVLTLLTTLLLQITSNLANDYGDFSHGVDNDSRVGPKRTLQSGLISPKEMRLAIICFGVLSFALGCALLYVARVSLLAKLVLLLLGLGAIYASVRYTTGSKPYGYRAMGDLAVFMFFGLVGVFGSYYLQTGRVQPDIFLPAAAVGFMSVAVLNINNIRDMQADSNAGKLTLAVLLGGKGSRIYHTLILSLSIAAMLIYSVQNFSTALNWLWVLVLPLMVVNALLVWLRQPAKLDPLLKQMALTTFLFSVLLCLGLNAL
ncbi:MAG: 1,4-dihydroxy-2-naphthoate polyprenyltransferase [Salibacteraceae bacterium]